MTLFNPLSSIAAGMEVLFTDDDFFEVLVWGIIFVFVIVGLFILNRVLRITYGGKVRSMGLDFGMKTQDLEKMKEEGQISEEEFKRIKKAMAKQYMSIAMSEERKTKMAEDVEVALQVAELEVVQEMENDYKKEVSVASEDPSRPPLVPMPSEGSEEIEPDPFPERLQPLLKLSEFELLGMKQAGFVTDEDLTLIKQQRMLDEL
jgi:hypothetical protein